MISPSVESHVISLKRSQKRFNDAKILTLKHKNMDVFHAIDYLDNPLFEQLRQKHKVNLTKGHAGCALSHIILLQQFLESTHKYTIILEDDCIINHPLPINNLQVELMFKRIGIRNFRQVDILFLTDRINYNKYYQVTGGCGTEGYIVTRHGAQKILRSLIKLDHPIDLRLLAHVPKYDNRHALSIIYPKLSINAYHSKQVLVSMNDNNISYVNGHID